MSSKFLNSSGLLHAFGLALGVSALAGSAAAAPQFAHVFTDHAVLQRSAAIHVWGTAKANDAVTVTLSTGETFTATADASGKWIGDLPPVHAGGPFTLSAAASDGTTTLKDIMIGDVFLCGGQSNMQFPLRLATGAWGGITPDANLRFISITQDSSPTPDAELTRPAEWKAVAPDTAGDASAVCYYMAKSLAKSQNVPVGMIDSYWGGTIIEAWISSESLRKLKGYPHALDALSNYAKDPATAQAAWTAETRDAWKTTEPNIAEHLAWIDPKFNDSGWKMITPDTGTWETSGDPDLANFDGIVWYRQTVNLTKAQAKQPASISLGPVDDGEITFVNGTVVGNTYGWDTPRDYTIPTGILKPGKNTIAVRALDSGGGGGMYGKMDRKITFADGKSVILSAQWKYRISGQPLPSASIDFAPWSSPNGLTNLYNAMIAPLAPYTLKGVAWYQGEANANAAAAYATLLPTMMSDWRRAFNNPTLPFLVVQLASYGPVATKPGPSSWAELRKSQRRVINADPHAALAVSIDFGDRSDIHPTQKNIIGQRLARAAQAVVYGQDVTPGGPDAASVTRSGADIVVHFRYSNGGLQTYSSNDAIGFEVCTAPNVCQYTPGTVQGDNVVLTGANRPETRIVRYAWADAPYTNLYSKDDLPAAPFAMDLP